MAAVQPGHTPVEHSGFSDARIAAAFDCLRVALTVFDRDDRLIYANEHFRYLYPCFKRIEPLLGLGFEEIALAIARDGDVDDETAQRDPALWARQRLAEHRSRATKAREMRLSNGCSLQIKERKTPDGGSVLLWVDITDAVRQRLRLEDAINGASDGFALWSRSDRLMACNDRFARLFAADGKLEPGIAYDRAMEDAVEAGRVRPIGDARLWLEQLLSGRPELGIRTEFKTDDHRWFQLTETPTRDGSVASVLTDITAIKASEMELRRRGGALERSMREMEAARTLLHQKSTEIAAANAELEAARIDAEGANAYKTSFLRSITHELRTPLNAIMGFSEVLETQKMGPLGNAKYIEYVGIIRSSGQHLLSLINQLLDLSRIEAGRMDLLREKHDAVEIARYCADMLQATAARGGVAVGMELPDQPVAVHVDVLATRQILLNLMSNAIKFTPDGGRVTLALQPAEGFCAFSVSDTGAGIAEEDLPRLMQPFMQAGDILTRRDKGSGLGLAIAKALTELQDGRIELQSELGVGTTVRVFLPLFGAPGEQTKAA